MENWKLVENIKELNTTLKSITTVVHGIWKYLTNPILLWNGFIGISYWVILLICLGGILLYIFGYKKGLRYSTIGIGIYSILQALNTVIK
jgi:hypothetical protein